LALADGRRPFQLSLFNPVQVFPAKYSIRGLRLNLLYSNTIVGKPDFYNDEAVFVAVIPPSNNIEIFIAKRDGTNQRRLTYTPYDNEVSPFQTKDGKSIAYRSLNQKENTYKDYIINKDGTDRREITEGTYSALSNERGKDLVKDFF